MLSPHFEPGQSPEEQIERKVQSLITELDELCVMAKDPLGADLLDNQLTLLSVVSNRARTALDLLLARQQPRLRMVRNG